MLSVTKVEMWKSGDVPTSVHKWECGKVEI